MKDLNIFDIDRIGSLTIDGNEVKLFSKNCEDEELCLNVEIGQSSNDDNAIIYLNMLNMFGKVDWTVKVDRYDREFKLIIKGKKSCDLLLEALKFVVGVLEEAKNK